MLLQHQFSAYFDSCGTRVRIVALYFIYLCTRASRTIFLSLHLLLANDTSHIIVTCKQQAEFYLLICITWQRCFVLSIHYMFILCSGSTLLDLFYSEEILAWFCFFLFISGLNLSYFFCRTSCLISLIKLSLESSVLCRISKEQWRPKSRAPLQALANH